MSHKDPDAPALDQAELQEDIERTRQDLAETIDELTARLDVKSRARDSLVEAKERARDRIVEAKAQTSHRIHQLRDRAIDVDGRPRPPVVAAAAALLAAVVTAAVLGRHRRSRRVSRRRGSWR
jgi:hypothetical protein